MKSRVCKIDLNKVCIHELNKALAFYYGQSAYITEKDGGTLYYNINIDDAVIHHLSEMSKSSSYSKLIDQVPSQHLSSSCCQMHNLAMTEIELENSTFLFDQRSIECMHLIKQIYIRMADHYFSTYHIAVPNIIETNHLHTAGYFEKFPAQAMLCATLPLQPFQVKDFIEMQRENFFKGLTLFSDNKYALNPVTCYHIYSNFSKLFNKYQHCRFTIEGKAHRYEGKNNSSGRLLEFHMIEMVFMENDADYIQLTDLIQFYKNFFLMLNIPVEFKTSSDAFFNIDAKLQAQLQERASAKIELICSFDQKNIAIGSINTHHDHFVKRFNLAKNHISTTKCTGIGIERLLLALYSYHSDHVKELLTHVHSSLNKEYSNHRRTEYFNRTM
ncbi:MAG TPA: aminoacyl--tRNA ligase-related protein [Legionellaceae bacterium]|nr:aminoacyl--tRNA ligase-related protein [Legionellaceae bacterium]